MDGPPAVDLLFTAANLLALRSRRLATELADALRPTGLTPVEAQVVWRIGHSPATVSQTDLARLTGASTTQVCGVIENLVKHGFVETERATNDRRRQCCRLTSDGKAMFQRVVQALGPLSRSCLAEWPIELPRTVWEEAA